MAFAVVGVTAGLMTRLREREAQRAVRWFEMSNDLLCETGLDGELTRVNHA